MLVESSSYISWGFSLLSASLSFLCSWEDTLDGFSFSSVIVIFSPGDFGEFFEFVPFKHLIKFFVLAIQFLWSRSR